MIVKTTIKFNICDNIHTKNAVTGKVGMMKKLYFDFQDLEKNIMKNGILTQM